MLKSILLALFTTSNQASVDAALQYATMREDCEVPLGEQPLDCPERFRWALLTISNRETIGSWSPDRLWVGRHTGDSDLEFRLYTKGHARGRLSLLCPFHWMPDGKSTVSPWGLMYVYNVQRFDFMENCVPWWLMSFAGVSVHAAADRYMAVCLSDDPDGWCPSTFEVVRTWVRYGRRRHEQPAWERALRAAVGAPAADAPIGPLETPPRGPLKRAYAGPRGPGAGA